MAHHNYRTDTGQFNISEPQYEHLNYRFDLTLPQSALPAQSDDELFVNAWLSKIGRNETPNVADIKNVTAKTPVKIFHVKNQLRRCLQIVDKLQQSENNLKINMATMSTEEWKKGTVEIGSLRDELSTIMLLFNNAQTLKTFKAKLSRRCKKRVNQKNRQIEARARKDKEIQEKIEAHKQIDKWLDDMKESVERAKSEENMKKDADCVLSEVTKKKSDARKQLGLISALNKLRNVREQMAMHRGEHVSTEDGVAFNIAVNRLTDMWENSMRTYGKEEQGLKIMLEQNASEDMKISSIAKDKQASQQWENVLFGQNYVPAPIYWGLTLAERDLETFIAIRKSWDTFLSRNHEGSKIPIGWVLPNSACNSSWSKYLQNT